MVTPLIPALTRLLFQVGRPSVRSLITTIYNKSGKTLSQKRLWELSKSISGIRQLEQIYNNISITPTLTSITEKIKRSRIVMLNDSEAKERDISSIEVRTYLAAKVLKRVRVEGRNGIKGKPFLVKLAANILSGAYSTKGFSLDEIVDYIDNTSLTDMISTFKTEALYYG